jgi:N-acylglucosamine 2-epimerase
MTEIMQIENSYRDHALSDLLPFWWKAVDTHNGGIFTCFDNSGAKLVSRNKYTWSQGRFVWLWSRVARMIAASMLPGDSARYMQEAARTVQFLVDNVFLANGNCAYALSETGEIIEDDASIYADCFVVLGFAEYATASADTAILQRALNVYDRIRTRLAAGNFRTEPYPIPAGYRSHSIAMILLRITQILADALQTLHHPRFEEFRIETIRGASEILNVFCKPDGAVWEVVPLEQRLNDTVLARHATPGHAFESMWFVIRTALQCGREEWIAQAARSIEWAFDVGWDRDFGGIFRYVDREGGKPRGIESNERYEALIVDTWDTKIWWPHAEALFATLLAHRKSGQKALESMHLALFEYVFRTFPNPDRSIGEWIQIRDRGGAPLDKCVALPVKDPYHILQDVLLIIELLHSEGKSVDFAPTGTG